LQVVHVRSGPSLEGNVLFFGRVVHAGAHILHVATTTRQEAHVARGQLQRGARLAALTRDVSRGINLADDHHRAALAQILVGRLRQPPPARHTEPPGLLTRVAIPPGPTLVDGDVKIRHRRTITHAAHLRISAKVSYDNTLLEHLALL